MSSALPFRFVDDPGSLCDAAALVVRIPNAARGKEKLLGVLAQSLRFPRYFGWNWDALEECLCDLTWLANVDRVVLVHEGLPLSPQGEQLAIYLDVLTEAVRRRATATGGPKLDVVFPTAAQADISG